MIVTGIGDYAGTVEAEYTIKPLKIKSATLSTKSYSWTGKAKKPAVTVKGKYKGELVNLVKGTDYTVTYENNTDVGKATAIITGIGNYKGTFKRTFTIKPKGTSLSKLTSAKKGQLTVTWKKQDEQIDKYMIEISTDKTFKTGVKRMTANPGTYTKTRKTGLTSGKTYYVRIRTYKKVGTTKYYSNWSAVKTVVVK